MTKKSTKIGRATTPQKNFPGEINIDIYIYVFFLIYKKRQKIQIHYCVLICRILIEDYVINMFFVGRGRKEKWAYGYTKPIANFLFVVQNYFGCRTTPSSQLSQLRRRLTT